MDVDDIDWTVHWEGLKLSVKMNIAEGFDYEAQTNFPLVVLNMALADAKQKHEGRRPIEEMEGRITEKALKVKKDNSAKYYRVMKELGSGTYGNVFLLERISDKKQFAWKRIQA